MDDDKPTFGTALVKVHYAQPIDPNREQALTRAMAQVLHGSIAVEKGVRHTAIRDRRSAGDLALVVNSYGIARAGAAR
jgi:hypothetical protein